MRSVAMVFLTPTKNPFDYQVEHSNEIWSQSRGRWNRIRLKPMSDLALRYAKVFNNKFAFQNQ